MEEFQVNAVGTGIIAGGEQLTLTSITVENVDSDVDRVRVSINNMGGVFNPVVGAVTSSMQNTLKYKVRTLANKEVKSRITEALTFVLPIVVPL